MNLNIFIRIQEAYLYADPCGSGSETLICFLNAPSAYMVSDLLVLAAFHVAVEAHGVLLLLLLLDGVL